MEKNFLYFFILIVLISCKSGDSEAKMVVLYKTGKTAINELNGIRFAIKAERKDSLEGIVEIRATLFNDNTDTTYFLTSACEGEQYSLRFDTTKFKLSPFMTCNASFPVVRKITPKGQYYFQAHFKCSNDNTEMKLGFDFFLVDKLFDLSDKSIGYINIFNRPVVEQTIIWSDNVVIR